MTRPCATPASIDIALAHPRSLRGASFHAEPYSLPRLINPLPTLPLTHELPAKEGSPTCVTFTLPWVFF